jgi:hypothetical protein
MFGRIRVTMVGAITVGAVFAGIASSAHAGVLSLAPGSCGMTESQPFAPWGDQAEYVPVPGGTFEPGSPSWFLSGGAKVVPGNETYDVSGPGAYSLSLPAGSKVVSPPACTGIDHPNARMFVRNTGSPSSRLNVWASYPATLGLLPLFTHVYLGQISGSSTWQPSSLIHMGLLLNTLGSLDLGETVVSFTFAPADSSGDWSIDDVYLDPACRW